MNESVNYEIIRRIKLSEVKTATTSGDIGVDKKYRKDMIEKWERWENNLSVYCEEWNRMRLDGKEGLWNVKCEMGEIEFWCVEVWNNFGGIEKEYHCREWGIRQERDLDSDFPNDLREFWGMRESGIFFEVELLRLTMKGEVSLSTKRVKVKWFEWDWRYERLSCRVIDLIIYFQPRCQNAVHIWICHPRTIFLPKAVSDHL